METKVTSIGPRGFALVSHVILVTDAIEAKFQSQVRIFGVHDLDVHIIDLI